MSVARTDARFLVPEPPRSAVVLGSLRTWEEGLERRGVAVADGSGPARPDLVIAPGHELAAALATGAEQIVLEGAVPARALQRAGYRARRYLSVPSLEAPLVYVPLGRRTESKYALSRIVVPPSRLKTLRNEALSLLLEHDRVPRSKLIVTVAARREPTPFIVDAVSRFGGTLDAEWLLSPGQSEAKGNVFYLFLAGSQEPDRVAKFRRAPAPIERAERERRGRKLLAAAPALIRDHAPTHIGCLQTNGVDVVVETAAPGMRLPSFLLSWRPRAAKLALVERVAAWLVDIAAQTAAAPAALASELQVQAEHVLPHWLRLGAPLDLVARVSSVPAVFQHHDLAVENVFAGDDIFTVIDWEAARRHGFPLCDLVFFLADALAHADGVSEGDAYTEHFVRLFRGELPSSAVLFKWAGQAARALRISREAIGPLTTVCWIERATWGAVPGDSITERDSPHVARARAWLSDPQLGAAWRAFPSL